MQNIDENIYKIKHQLLHARFLITIHTYITEEKTKKVKTTYLIKSKTFFFNLYEDVDS